MTTECFFARCWRVSWMAGLGGAAAFLGGRAAESLPLEIAGRVLLVVAGVAFSPFAMIIALSAVVLALAIVVLPPAFAVHAWRVFRAVRAIDALDAREAPEREYDAPFARLDDGTLDAARERVLDVTRPSRRRWVRLADDDTLAAIAGSADPVAPDALNELRRRKGEAVAQEEIVRAWAKDVR
jgi:hypothetical protein